MKAILARLPKGLKEALLSVLPLTILVLVLSFTPLFNLTPIEYITFGVASLLLIFGIALFNIGANVAMSPMGEQIGSSLTRTKKIFLLVVVIFAMGLFITIAEPDLFVLSRKVSKDFIKQLMLIVATGIGVGIFLVIAVLKIIFKKDLIQIILYFYYFCFGLVVISYALGYGRNIALAFDSGGVTTGPITVPFIMALGVGVAHTIGGRKQKENSFGLVSLCSIGPILVLLLFSIFFYKDTIVISTESMDPLNIDNIGFRLLNSFLNKCIWVGIALLLILVFFLTIQFFMIKLPKKKIIQLLQGALVTFFGVVIFLTAAEIGFEPIGYKIGQELASNSVMLTLVGFVIGLVVVFAEPAVSVLTKQVEEITTGAIKKSSLLIALSIGVAISIGLSMIRIIYNFPIIYILVPGYLLSLGLSFFVPKMYTAIAFDSGGVASGPLTSSFILPLTLGATSILQRDHILEDAFGVVSLVALAPLITIQILGFKGVIELSLRRKNRMKAIINSEEDNKIIYF